MFHNIHQDASYLKVVYRIEKRLVYVVIEQLKISMDVVLYQPFDIVKDALYVVTCTAVDSNTYIWERATATVIPNLSKERNNDMDEGRSTSTRSLQLKRGEAVI